MSREAVYDKFLLFCYLILSVSPSSQQGIAIGMIFTCLVLCGRHLSYQSNKTERIFFFNAANKSSYIRNNEFKTNFIGAYCYLYKTSENHFFLCSSVQ